MRHVSSGELVKHELKCGAIGDTWHLVSGWKSMVDGYEYKEILRANENWTCGK